MPSALFNKIARDFRPSSGSLFDLSSLFGTSIWATALRIRQLDIWNATFVLWQKKSTTLHVRWVVSSHLAGNKSRNVCPVDFERSSVCSTFDSGKPSESHEWFSFDGQYLYGRIESVRIRPDLVLSCISKKPLSPSSKEEPSGLLVKIPDDRLLKRCVCDGSGWIYEKRGSYSGVQKCLAPHHPKGRMARE